LAILGKSRHGRTMEGRLKKKCEVEKKVRKAIWRVIGWGGKPLGKPRGRAETFMSFFEIEEGPGKNRGKNAASGGTGGGE